ncbi:MAG TPA: carbohydrate ABC transporter permease [Ktedonobacteraceae bacterium]|jgi:raffinose/stachyose/melibiose transport system permease protein|nr:carbohydrate ABC transporter permease [Ktedonobacteraceae bacterium]
MYTIQQTPTYPRATLQANLVLQRRRRMMRLYVQLFPRYVICVLVAIFVLVPILTAFIGGFKTSGELLNSPFSLPIAWQWQNYANVLTQSMFWQAAENSIIVMLATVGLLMVIACPVSFVFARMPFRGREVIFNIMLIGLLFPFAMAILPLYITLRTFHLIDTLLAVILPQVAFGLPVTILILRNFFRDVPQELEDATYIDGGTQVDFFWRVLMPLARPALATVGMLTMVASWNNFLLPLLVLNSPQLWTLPLGITQFQSQFSTDWASVMAFISIAMIPAIIFYLFAERYLITGLTAGAVKG